MTLDVSSHGRVTSALISVTIAFKAPIAKGAADIALPGKSGRCLDAVARVTRHKMASEGVHPPGHSFRLGAQLTHCLPWDLLNHRLPLAGGTLAGGRFPTDNQSRTASPIPLP